MGKTTKILVAVNQLVGGTKGKRASLAAGEELTAGAIKALGLNQDDVADLIGSGAVKEVEARTAATSSDAATDKAAEEAAAELAAAKATIAELEDKVAELEKQLEEATESAAKA